ncbi:pyridoxal phosphate-dependent transferase [Microdochium trichocladiopsis]|uniref:Pyridoxal phosphate-dependent transferase n=1 Tax=Microdochium trichocladiopsis TaxID=1682393 RepID=A0A9P8Y7Y5_9PEZI|nr:pyridoxal phosphate-dependent transferase [Microdochium trichocladiopsis]KAH7031358.1 pyridoxal phosphate-dependent transferase [Microdochium trichocladiopsis]
MSKAYNDDVERLRPIEYPHMNNGVYLDHSGTTIYAKSAIERFSQKMLTDLYGNPHSENSPAKLSGNVIEDVRARTLNFLGADPEHFDLVFVANATAGIKLVAEAFRDLGEKTRSNAFWYGYHRDSHTSLVGVRELAYGQFHCFENDADVEAWLSYPEAAMVNRQDHRSLGLFAYPGQSNLTGKRLPLRWAGCLRQTDELQNTYTLLDAAALAMTLPMSRVFADPDTAPDFTCLSLYKIFGFPDLGALVVRRQSGHILGLRRYFGGGTVKAVGVIGDVFHRSRGQEGPSDRLHEGLEDGTLPFHSILALGEAIDVHMRLFTSMEVISDHTQYLATRLRHGLILLRHPNGRPVCRVYFDSDSRRDQTWPEDPAKYGPAVAFNVIDHNGQFVTYKSVEEIANKASIYIRSGGVCNPGGIYSVLGYEPWMIHRAVQAGHICGGPGTGVLHNMPTGVVRASVGAMSTQADVDALITFIRTTFVENHERPAASPVKTTNPTIPQTNGVKNMAPPTYNTILLPMPNGIQTRQEIQNKLQ